MADLIHAIQISENAAAILPLVSTADGLAKWWAEDVSEQGGTVDLGFFNRSTGYSLRLAGQEPSSGATWECESGAEWEGTRLIFDLEPSGSGTRLRFTHAGWHSKTDYFVSCNTTWGALMLRLKATAEGKPAGPLFSKEVGRA